MVQLQFVQNIPIINIASLLWKWQKVAFLLCDDTHSSLLISF